MDWLHVVTSWSSKGHGKTPTDFIWTKSLFLTFIFSGLSVMLVLYFDEGHMKTYSYSIIIIFSSFQWKLSEKNNLKKLQLNVLLIFFLQFAGHGPMIKAVITNNGKKGQKYSTHSN